MAPALYVLLSDARIDELHNLVCQLCRYSVRVTEP
jgi:hypothetical protein